MKQDKGEKKIEKKFNELKDEIQPKPKVFKNCINAFWIGGVICLVGEFIRKMLLSYNIPEEQVATCLPIIMIFIGALLTGIGIYDKIASLAGAGTLVPITGFSNAIVSPAIEFKSEGFITGVGVKMFTIAGPVLVYGISSSVAVGIIYYILLRLGVVV